MARLWFGLLGFMIFQSLALICGFVAYLHLLEPYVHVGFLFAGLPIAGWTLTITTERMFGWIGIQSTELEAEDDPSFFLAWRLSEFDDWAQDDEGRDFEQELTAELSTIQV
jgi:hypothetical protein